MAERCKLIICFNPNSSQTDDELHELLANMIIDIEALEAKLSHGWITKYGDYPKYMLQFVTPNLHKMEAVLASDWWQDIIDKINPYVTDLSYVVVPAKSGFQFVKAKV